MKKIKKVLSLWLALCMLLLTNIVSFAAKSPYDILLEKGFPSEYLDTLSEEILIKTLNAVGDNEINSFNTETVYLQENNGDIQTYGAISENSLSLTITSYTLGGDNIINALMIAISWEWSSASKPFIRKTDSIVVNWDPSLFYLNEDAFISQDRVFSHGPDWVIHQEYGRPAESNQGGLGYYTKLMWRTDISYVNGGDTLFLLTSAVPMKTGTDYGTSINVNYVHNRSTILQSLSFSVPGIGVGVNCNSLNSDSASATTNFRFSR